MRYIELHNPHEMKQKSLEDNVYFTLRDIFLNALEDDYAVEANYFNKLLTNNIPFENRDDNFEYTSKLNDKDFLEQLIKFLQCIQCDKNVFINKESYVNPIDLQDWLNNLEELIYELNKLK
jgi:hypothetical protein